MSVRGTARSVAIFLLPLILGGCNAVKTTPPPAPPPQTRFAIVVNQVTNNISSFAVDSQTGILSPKGMVATGGMRSRIIAVEPSGRFAYVGNVDSNDISVFAIDTKTG